MKISMRFLLGFLVLCSFVCSSRAASPDPEEVLKLENIRPKGRWYEAAVPDTLDLAERARISINALTRIVDQRNGYAAYQQFIFQKDPPQASIPSGHQWKHARALPLMRTMCGSEQNLDVELGLMRHCLDRPSVIQIWQARDGNPAWVKWMEQYRQDYPRQFAKTVFYVDDRAYTPPEGSLQPDGTWKWTDRGPALVPYRPPEEPTSDQQGFEGAVKWSQAIIMRELLCCFRSTNDVGAWELCNKFSRFVLKPGMWEDTRKEGYPGYEHGIWAGHWHGNITTLYILLDLALKQRNERLKQLVREAYDHARRNMVRRVGWTPMWMNPTKFNRPAFESNEGCGTADTVVLAVKLTDAGLGDYWDDVDAIVRNHLVESQIVNIDVLRKASGNDPKNDPLLERFVGGFGGATPTNHVGELWGCCTANGPVAYYYAWHGITRFDEGVATVNLFLNRASAWMDIDSYLPYEGKVILHNKLAHTALVRVPAWVEMDKVNCFVDGKTVRPQRAGRYLLFAGLAKGATIRLEFPVTTSRDQYTINGQTYTFEFRGSTVVDVSPRPANDSRPPIFARADMKAAKAPMHSIKRFVAERMIPLP